MMEFSPIHSRNRNALSKCDPTRNNATTGTASSSLENKRHEITRDRHEITLIHKSANAFVLIFDTIWCFAENYDNS